MKKFTFKLEALLKLREFREKKIEIEMGEILQEIQNQKNAIARLNGEISEAYIMQEKMIENLAPAKMIEFYPYFIQNKKEHIKVREKEISKLELRFQRKVEDLKKAMGDVKVIEKLKHQKQNDHRKYRDKKEQEQIEEVVSMQYSRSATKEIA